MQDPLVIDCDDCVVRHDGLCDDCVVTFIVGREPDDAVVVDVDQVRALRLLADADMVPTLRHQASWG